MNTGYVAASYVPPGGTKKEKEHRQEQWEQYQQQMHRASWSSPQKDPPVTSTPVPASRKRADSHSQTYTQYESQAQRRFLSASNYNTLHTTQSSSPPGVRRISGNFNAPTHVEIERHNDTAKSTRSKIKRLENTIKGWVRT